jgi:hypothetical protein
MSKKIIIDRVEIFSLKYIIIMGLAAAILALASWIIVAINININLFQLKDAENLSLTLAQVSMISTFLANQMLHFIFGMIFSGIMLLLTIFLIKDNALVLMDYTFSRSQLGILLIIISVCNMIVGVNGFWVGGILGIVTGVFTIIHDMYMEEWRMHRQLIF